MRTTTKVGQAVLILLALCYLAAVAVADEPVSHGKMYAYTTKNPSAVYADHSYRKLTDGRIGDLDFRQPEWIGTYTNSPFAITIDLEEYQVVTRVRTYVFAGVAGIQLPGSLAISVSTDGEKWSEPVGFAISEPNPTTATAKWYEMDGFKLEGRWVRVTYGIRGAGINLFISEIEIY